MSLDLNAVKARADKATPGPWHATDNGTVTHDGPNEATWGSAWGTYVAPSVGAHGARKPSDADAEFIAHAREDVPELLALVERQAAELARYAEATAEIDRLWAIVKASRTAARRITSVLVACADRIDIPFTNADTTPWELTIKPAINNLRAALGMRGYEQVAAAHAEAAEHSGKVEQP